jgi:hypothetical protein
MRLGACWFALMTDGCFTMSTWDWATKGDLLTLERVIGQAKVDGKTVIVAEYSQPYYRKEGSDPQPFYMLVPVDAGGNLVAHSLISDAVLDHALHKNTAKELTAAEREQLAHLRWASGDIVRVAPSVIAFPEHDRGLDVDNGLGDVIVYQVPDRSPETLLFPYSPPRSQARQAGCVTLAVVATPVTAVLDLVALPVQFYLIPGWVWTNPRMH